jgi:hypothetical protein
VCCETLLEGLLLETTILCCETLNVGDHSVVLRIAEGVPLETTLLRSVTLLEFVALETTLLCSETLKVCHWRHVIPRWNTEAFLLKTTLLRAETLLEGVSLETTILCCETLKVCHWRPCYSSLKHWRCSIGDRIIAPWNTESVLLETTLLHSETVLEGVPLEACYFAGILSLKIAVRGHHLVALWLWRPSYCNASPSGTLLCYEVILNDMQFEAIFVRAEPSVDVDWKRFVVLDVMMQGSLWRPSYSVAARQD